MEKCFSLHEKIQLIRNLATKTFYNKKVKPTIVSYKMNPVHYKTFQFTTIAKLSKNFTLSIDKISLKQMQNRASLY